MRADGKFPPRRTHPLKPFNLRSSEPGATMRVVWLSLLLLAVLGGGCSTEVRGTEAARSATAADQDQRAAPPTVILISLDGTRPADVTAEATPSLVKLAVGGASAAGLVPVNPSNTFPSHVSLVTGVHPDEHRLVNNRFIDPDRGRFKRSAPHEWIESEPVSYTHLRAHET